MKKILAVLFVMFALNLPARAAFYGAMVEEDAYISASSQFEKKDYSAAAKEYAAFLEKFPESKYKAPSLLKMAELSENIEDAMKYYNMVINDFPGTPYEAEAVYGLAKLFYAGGDYKKARVYFNIIITKFPSMVWVEESYYMLMLCAGAEHDTAIFEKAYDEYNSKGYFSFRSRVNMAYAGYLFGSGKYDRAIVMYRELIDKTQGKDGNIYMPLVYLNASLAAKKINDDKSAEMLENDLKFKYPDSPEAKGGKPAEEGKFSQAQPTAAPIKPSGHKAAAKAVIKEFYTMQIGAYSNKKLCDLTAEKLIGKKYEVFVKKDGKFYKISVGKFATKQEAENFAPGMAKKEKLKSWLIKQARE